MHSLYSLLITKSMYIAMLLTSFIAKVRFSMIWYGLTCLMDEVCYSAPIQKYCWIGLK